MEPSTEKNLALIETAKSLANTPWCEQYERMISGMLYDPLVPELMQSRYRARKLMSKYNAPIPDDISFEDLTQQRENLLKQLLGQVGKGAFIEPPLMVDYGCNIKIGDGFYANFNTTILDCSLIIIGDRVAFGPNVSILAATHETSVESRRNGVEFAKEVVIGDDCWIGARVSILAGVHIGKGCTIGAGAVVTKHVPPFSVAVGSPARVVKQVEPVD
ncbi:hypothetical protein AtubIFM55763_002562 [Aspergillus tubingensis]|uniref:Uncharacterized protein n=1 Tax=Aspergillus tubingensis TaxID=5068 RepID=A0A8H3Y2Y7_ASPTU|nr:galactoside O-acetyltransferase [Aspergillus tubingensis]GFN20914.1 galactoside O-acetyltransferase [Aspergillus tubingensis]GLA72044.1 hypothetical protein AtubIFM55763_002562 [Aspergillus tubingensis]GLA88965.1 hypothetical protein AtubIFM56815_003433 [Aspergillus tubingensis]GLA99273.1 hypothetical protein AtubIFM57143_007579 [Aspergillus tubingensis]